MLNQIETGNIFTSISIWQLRIFKSGNVVTLIININGVMAADTGVNRIANLPQDCLPIFGIAHNYINQVGIPMMISITTDGTIAVYNGGKQIDGSWICRQCITFICK